MYIVVENLVLDLIQILQIELGARILFSRITDKIVSNDLAILYGRMDSNQLDIVSAISLIEQIVSNKLASNLVSVSGDSSPERPVSPRTEEANAQLLSQSLKFIDTLPPAPTYPTPISRPILIPQTRANRFRAGLGNPFLRAYAPCLQASNIPLEGFLSFIDALNIVSSPAPPLQLLNGVGGILGFMPSSIAQLTGFGVQVSSQIGTAAVSKIRTNMFLKKVNAGLFGPRRLRVRIIAAGEVPRVLRIPESRATIDDNWDDSLDIKVLKLAFCN